MTTIEMSNRVAVVQGEDDTTCQRLAEILDAVFRETNITPADIDPSE